MNEWVVKLVAADVKDFIKNTPSEIILTQYGISSNKICTIILLNHKLADLLPLEYSHELMTEHRQKSIYIYKVYEKKFFDFQTSSQLLDSCLKSNN